VKWNDGKESLLKSVAANQQIEVNYDKAVRGSTKKQPVRNFSPMNQRH